MGGAMSLAYDALFGDPPSRSEHLKLYDPKRSTMRKHLWRASEAQAMYWARQGMITEHEFRAWKLASTWCSPRFGGDAANSQERYFHVMGFEALKRRRERATSLWFKFCFGEHL